MSSRMLPTMFPGIAASTSFHIWSTLLARLTSSHLRPCFWSTGYRIELYGRVPQSLADLCSFL